MIFDLQHFRTKLGKKIVLLFFLSALVPTATLAVLSYNRVRTELEDQTRERLDQGTTDAAMAIIERVQAIESEMILLAASIYRLGAAVSAGFETPLEADDLRRLSDVSLVFDRGGGPTSMVGSLRELPELSDAVRANVTMGQTVLTVAGGEDEGDLQILIARAWDADQPEGGTIWGRIIGDSLWSTAQVYATSIASTEVDFQDDRGYCILGPLLRPIDCAGGLVSWTNAGPPEGLLIAEDSVHGSTSWVIGGKRYFGHYRRIYLRGFNSENWTIVVGESEAAMLATLGDFRRNLIGFLVLPLAELREGTRRIPGGGPPLRRHADPPEPGATG